MKKKNLFNILIPIVVGILCLILGVAAMFVIVKMYPDYFTETKVKKEVTVTDSGIADSVEKVYDAVVVVTTYKNQSVYATGTGFVYKVDGNDAYILTNNHVIEGGTKVKASFTNGSVIETTVVGSDPLSDIGVLKVNKSDILAIAEMGSSENLRVGDTLFAVGAPVDNIYSWTVTRGILSGKDRMVEVKLSNSNGDYVMKVLQTDTAINNGNSGGPLCNANGEVIGVNSLKLSGNENTSASIEGMGFAIPIEIAIDYAEKIISGEKITQPFLGVQMLNVTNGYYYPQYSSYLEKHNITTGVIVTGVELGSPAEKAGIRTTDIIVKIGENNVNSIAYLRYYLYNYNVGDEVIVTVIRDGKTEKVNVTLGSND